MYLLRGGWDEIGKRRWLHLSGGYPSRQISRSLTGSAKCSEAGKERQNVSIANNKAHKKKCNNKNNRMGRWVVMGREMCGWQDEERRKHKHKRSAGWNE